MIVWLASIPRSGNTLLRIILNSVFGRARGPRILFARVNRERGKPT